MALPLLGLVVGMIGRTSWELLVATLLLLQVVLLGYWLMRLKQARRQAESVDPGDRRDEGGALLVISERAA